MLTASHYYVIISDCEMGPKCRAILKGYLGSIELAELSGDIYKIELSSAEEQEKLYERFKAAMHLDFPADAEIKRIRAENEMLRDRLSDEPPATVHSIITDALRRLGADGLCTDGCGCGLADLAPCGHMGMHCIPARRMTVVEAITRGYDTLGCHPCVAYYAPLNSIDHNSADTA